MFKGTANLIVDLGNSETRFIVKVGKLSSPIRTLSNRFAIASPGYLPPEGYSDDHVFFDGESTIVSGDLAAVEFSSFSIAPTALQPKASSPNTSWTMHIVLFEALREVSRLVGSPLPSLDIDFQIKVLVPPAQTTPELRTALIERISSLPPLSFSHPSSPTLPTTPPRIQSVELLPEGIAAFMAVAFNKDRSLKEPSFSNTSVLILDIGAGTTDVSVAERLRPVKSTWDTLSLGGNNVAQLVARALRDKGYSPRDSRLQEAILSGILMDGNTPLPIHDIIEDSRRRVAEALYSRLRGSFESSLYDPSSINYLLTVGGGSVSPAQGESIGQMLVRHLREIAPNIELISVDPDSDSDPRLLNILGASL